MLKKALAAAAIFLAAQSVLAAVDVNKANEAELDGVKGLGPATTQLILDQRKTGTFKNWDDLITRVKGIGPARAARLSAEGLTVSGESFKQAAKPQKTQTSTKEAKK